ncbi:hypothetical protein DB346_05855 [Verrucomicrobia bacterium LW23]|nr:hypothetical protein DB346_05855 [Verrucomicrobia bacterium LW23]
MTAQFKYCEACRKAPVAIVNGCDSVEYPYKLCQACNNRLESESLRPIEWYNLACIHGPWGDNLGPYLEDGSPDNPESGLTRAEIVANSAPTLANVKLHAEALLEFTISRFSISQDLRQAWCALSPEEVLRTVTDHFAINRQPTPRECCLKVIAATQGARGAAFVRYCWGEFPALSALALAEASAACLPEQEAFDRCIATIHASKGAEKRESIRVLEYLRSPLVLDWIEREIFEPITEIWGEIAAPNSFDWTRAEAWLRSGRPLSLVAIDALGRMAANESSLTNSPRLAARPGRRRLVDVLSAYAKADPVPRVQHRVALLITMAEPYLFDPDRTD